VRCGRSTLIIFICFLAYFLEVPARWERNKSLSYWVVRQRMLCRRQSLSPEKVRLLEDIGFTWGFSLEKYQQGRHVERCR
jgi:hypothetical protein